MSAASICAGDSLNAQKSEGHKARFIFDRHNIVNEAALRDAMQRTQDHLRTARNSRSAPL